MKTAAMTILAAAAAAAMTAAGASAQTLTMGTPTARSCYNAALAAMAHPDRIETCRQALADPMTSTRDRAATHANLGILLALSDNDDGALEQYQHAIRIRPDLGQAYYNRGALLLRQDDHMPLAEADFSRALDLGGAEREKALLGRAIARESLGNVRGAYEDLSSALKHRPGWEPAELELSRYQVTPANS